MDLWKLRVWWTLVGACIVGALAMWIHACELEGCSDYRAGTGPAIIVIDGYPVDVCEDVPPGGSPGSEAGPPANDPPIGFCGPGQACPGQPPEKVKTVWR